MLVALVMGSIMIALAYVSAFFAAPYSALGPWMLALGIPVQLFSLLLMGVKRDGSPLKGVFWLSTLAFVIVTGAFIIGLLLPTAPTSTNHLYLGLPLGAAVVLYGAGLIPLFLLPVVYTLTFNFYTLSEQDLEYVRSSSLEEYNERAQD